jgi:SOS response associated peptidase (SRAP)
MNVPTAGQKRFVIVAATGMVGGYTLRYALEHPAVGRVTVIGRRKVGAGNMPAAEKIGGDHSARAKIIGPLNPPGGITGPVMRHELVAQIHPRMPAIPPEQHHAAWLGETDDGNLKDLLVPYPADQMRMWKISPRVNSPKNDDPSLWEPLHAEPTQTTSDALELLRE